MRGARITGNTLNVRIPAELLIDLFNNHPKARRAGARVKFRNQFFWAVSEELTSKIFRAGDRFPLTDACMDDIFIAMIEEKPKYIRFN